jgi:hypothetical protein
VDSSLETRITAYERRLGALEDELGRAKELTSAVDALRIELEEIRRQATSPATVEPPHVPAPAVVSRPATAPALSAPGSSALSPLLAPDRIQMVVPAGCHVPDCATEDAPREDRLPRAHERGSLVNKYSLLRCDLDSVPIAITDRTERP